MISLYVTVAIFIACIISIIIYIYLIDNKDEIIITSVPSTGTYKSVVTTKTVTKNKRVPVKTTTEYVALIDKILNEKSISLANDQVLMKKYHTTKATLLKYIEYSQEEKWKKLNEICFDRRTNSLNQANKTLRT